MLSQVLSAKNSNKEAFITRKWIRAYASILNLFHKVCWEAIDSWEIKIIFF